MTIEEFTRIVEDENLKHNGELLKLEPSELIDRAWEIAKWQSIYNYIEGKVIFDLENGGEMFKGFLTFDTDSPISMLYSCKFDYDDPQWMIWDNLDDLACGMLA